MQNRDEMMKIAKDIWVQAEQRGRDIFAMFKAAQQGNPQVLNFLKVAQEMADAAAAEAGMAPADGSAAAAPVADGSAPGTAGPNGIMVCPVCGSQITPTLDMTCPVCGSDVSQAVQEAISPQQPPMAAPSPEEVANVGEQVVQAAMRDQNAMAMLISQYGSLV